MAAGITKMVSGYKFQVSGQIKKLQVSGKKTKFHVSGYKFHVKKK